MSCDQPGAGDCTNVSPCGNSGCGCSTTSPTPILPRCQDVSLAAGTFTHATIVVNAEGCITSVTQGEPELYTPDECCGDQGGSTGGSVIQGPPGDDGDPGAAATISVEESIDTGAGAAWLVENTGTSTAAIFRFTSPAPIPPPSGTTGETGTLDGFLFEDGLVKEVPASIVTRVTAGMLGDHAALAMLEATPNPAQAGRFDIKLDLDPLRADLVTLINEQAARIDALTDTVADLNNTVEELRTDFDAHAAANP